MRLITFVILSLLASLAVPAQIRDAFKGVLLPTDKKYVRQLNGTWKFKYYDSKDWSQDAEFYQPAYNDLSWSSISVPACWDALGWTEPRYVHPKESNGLYRTAFTIPATWKGHRVFLRFDGVLRGYELWVNGHYVDKWESAFNSCQFDISPYIEKGSNVLAVRVYTRYKGFDFDSNDDWGQAGINRPIMLFAVPDRHFRDVTVRTEHVSKNQATVNIRLSTGNYRLANTLRIQIKDPEGMTVYQEKEKMGISDFNRQITLKNPALWTAETPALYTMTCELNGGQAYTVRFGIREVTIRKNVLLLNGEKFKLRGINLHETSPFSGKCVGDSLDLKDLRMMKEANINFIRCSHYPRSPRFLEICDSIGMYVMNEIPFGFGDGHLNDSSYQDILLTRANATVLRDKNHPSILFWSIGNENPLTPITEATGRYVKSLDPTRPICYPMIHEYFLGLDFKLPDFIDIFAPHYPTVATLRYYAESARRPVILTEYCHSLGLSLEQHDELWDIIEHHDNLAGGAVWEWVDQGMVFRNQKFPGRYGKSQDIWLNDSTRISMEGNQGTDGILYPNRIPNSNYYEIQKNYSQAVVQTKELRGNKGVNNVVLTIANRHDFANLKDLVHFEWILKDGWRTVDSGRFAACCKPRSVCSVPLQIQLPTSPTEACYYLEIRATSKKGARLGISTLPIRDAQGNHMHDLFGLRLMAAEPANSAAMSRRLSHLLQPGIMLRAGRKHSLSEDIHARQSVSHYLILPQWQQSTQSETVWRREVLYANSEFSARGTFHFANIGQDGIALKSVLRPQTPGKQILEGGIAFLLKKGINNVQWIGMGPYASYPGKKSANYFGLHSLTAGDLYFEGNRMEVDMALCTDTQGRGILVLAPNSNMGFEETDQGIILSVNPAVSGLCGKLRATAYPVFSEDITDLESEVYIFPVDEHHQPGNLFNVFSRIQQHKAFTPFLTQYDNYVLRLHDILESQWPAQPSNR